ncbi:hypothetical protein C1645_824160 [Glomus cerebriforme]|uniref:Myb/SANT-like domain-containing protein n=1 Tax=Glomus cerebriforme TaxID=658196 RepID=A0A397SUS3_9GLOM|nr:hypothetical protein C1645_824160 [Glomus cerebriforme]
MSNPKFTFHSITPKPQESIQNSDVIAMISKKKNDQKQERVGFVEEKTGWNDTSTGLLLIFSGKLWEQIKNKLACLVAKYNEIKEKESQTGGEVQAAKWKWFERLDTLFGTYKNHNSTFLINRISDDTQFFDCKKNKEEDLGEKNVKKWKSLLYDPLAETMISISNIHQTILEKQLAFESE